jgi:hypothetical protein
VDQAAAGAAILTAIAVHEGWYLEHISGWGLPHERVEPTVSSKQGQDSVVEHPAGHVSGSIRQATLLQGDNLGLQQKQLQQAHFQIWEDMGISGTLRSKL